MDKKIQDEFELVKKHLSSFLPDVWHDVGGGTSHRTGVSFPNDSSSVEAILDASRVDVVDENTFTITFPRNIRSFEQSLLGEKAYALGEIDYEADIEDEDEYSEAPRVGSLILTVRDIIGWTGAEFMLVDMGELANQLMFTVDTENGTVSSKGASGPLVEEMLLDGESDPRDEDILDLDYSVDPYEYRDYVRSSDIEDKLFVTKNFVEISSKSNDYDLASFTTHYK